MTSDDLEGDVEGETYCDARYCCMQCGSETFETQRGPRDRCSSCGSIRDVKRGPADV